MKIYIAGKISGLDPHIAYDKFKKYELQLQEAGHDPVNPFEVNNIKKEDIGSIEFIERSWSSYLKNDIKAMLDCDEIHLLPGWQTSKGTTLERDIAMRLGILIIYPN